MISDIAHRNLRPTLGGKFVAAAIVLSVIPMLIVGLIGFNLGRRGIHTHTDLHLRSVVALQARQIAHWLDQQREIVDSYVYSGSSQADVQALVQMDPAQPDREAAEERMEAEIRDLVGRQLAIEAIAVANGKGEISYASLPAMADESKVREYLEEGRAGPYLGLDEVGGLFSGQRLIWAEPSRVGEGVVLSILKPSGLLALLEPDEGLGSSGVVYLANPEGELLTFQGGGVLDEAAARTLTSFHGAEDLVRFLSPGGIDLIGRSEAIQGLPWVVVAAVPVADAFADAQRMRMLLITVVIGIGLLGAVAAWLFSRSLTRPLALVVEGAQSIGGGDLERRIAVKSSDEVGQLGASFNRMAERLSGLYRAIEEERNTLAAIQASMVEGLVVVRRDGVIVYFNDAVAEILGIGAASAEGRTLHEMLEAHRTAFDPAGALTRIGELVVEPPQDPIEIEFTWTELGRKDLAVVAFPIRFQGASRMVGFLFHDVTRERESLRRRDEFVSIASHELRTPMTGVLGFSELLLMRADMPEASKRQAIEVIHKESLRLTSIVDDLLNVSRIQSGRTEIQPQFFLANDLVVEVRGRMALTSDRHDLALDVAADPLTVFADRDKVIEILVNLVSNAIKYSPNGGTVTIRARAHDSDYVALSVSDQGIGIAADDIAQLFTLFHRVKTAETEGIRGTGLGLYIVKHLTELMGGEVWAESTPMKGSTFTVTLPVRPAAGTTENASMTLPETRLFGARKSV